MELEVTSPCEGFGSPAGLSAAADWTLMSLRGAGSHAGPSVQTHRHTGRHINARTRYITLHYMSFS